MAVTYPEGTKLLVYTEFTVVDGKLVQGKSWHKFSGDSVGSKGRGKTIKTKVDTDQESLF